MLYLKELGGKRKFIVRFDPARSVFFFPMILPLSGTLFEVKRRK
jgi:hypothetical protein